MPDVGAVGDGETQAAATGLRHAVVMADRCHRCQGDLPRASHVFAVMDGVEVPFCTDEHMRATLRELPFEVEHIGVTITPRWAPGDTEKGEGR